MRTGASSYAFATLFERVSAEVPDRPALASHRGRRTFAELDERASLLAGWLRGQGVRHGMFVGIQMRNRPEYVEAMLAAYKLRAVPININYRLGDAELEYVYTDSQLVGVIHDDDFGAVVKRVAERVAARPWSLPTGAEYEAALKMSMPALPQERSQDDLYVLYTGGTTGRPKGVVWRMEDAFFSCVGGGDPTSDRGPISDPEEIVERILSPGAFLPAAPLVHAAGMWTTLRWLLAGWKVVLIDRFSAPDAWRAIAAERVNTMNIVGDAMAKPLLEAWPAAAAELDLTCLRLIVSGGARLSVRSRDGLLNALPHLTVRDTYGSSETGTHGWAVYRHGDPHPDSYILRDTVLLDPQTSLVMPPGLPKAGLVARRGHVPLRYHGDPQKSAGTFVNIDGARHAVTGDLGIMREDGTLHLLGRGSQCINSGGEKIYPEEVEQVLQQVPGVDDAVLVGIPDARWGEQAVALVAAGAGCSPREQDIRTYCRAQLADFKTPKHVVVVAAVRRTVAGKPDYTWAREVAMSALAPAPATEEPAR
jgi:acyl-CoA synthetase (AMP-forming)/AMP-acid ligase II